VVCVVGYPERGKSNPGAIYGYLGRGMIRITVICDDCGADHWIEAANTHEIDFEKLPNDWAETAGGGLYCSGCKGKHASEIVDDPVPVAEQAAGQVEGADL